MSDMANAIKLYYSLKRMQEELEKFDLRLAYDDKGCYIIVNKADNVCSISTVEELDCFMVGLHYGYAEKIIEKELGG